MTPRSDDTDHSPFAPRTWRAARPETLPASGAWRPGDPLGERRFLRTAADRPFVLEGSGQLRDIDLAFETWGTLDEDGTNAVLLCHALTGDSHASGPAGPDRHRPLLRGVRQRAGWVSRLDRTILDQTRWAGSLRRHVPGRVDPRPGSAVRPARRPSRGAALALDHG